MSSSNSPIRTGEILIQDRFQRYLEAGLATRGTNQKVVLWNESHQALRLDPVTGKTRSMVVMRSLDQTTDRSFGASRKIENANIWGLIDAIEAVNRVSFENWLAEYPQVNLNVSQLSEIAASHLADLYENHNHGALTSTWRLLLALGERYAWERSAALFGLEKDPRVLLARNIPGASSKMRPLYYRPCYTSNESPRAFLDLRPTWLDELPTPTVQKITHHVDELLRAVHSGKAPQNRHAWIRELRLGQDQAEYADFGLLINGLPLSPSELKTPAAGIKEAVRDFQTKPTYQGSPLGLASDGSRVIMSSTMEGKLEAWVLYANNLGTRPLSEDPEDPLDSAEYVATEILSRPDRVEFLLRHASSINNQGRFLVSRSQQYQALGKWERDLAWARAANTVLASQGEDSINIGNRLIRHTQRTGKTHTMIRAIHLALGSYPEQFRLSTLMVGEVQILDQIQREMEKDDLGVSDSGIPIFRIETRAALEKALQSERAHASKSQGRILLANMQKISPKSTQAIAIPDSHKTLVVIDEGHLSQTGSTADIRDRIFPNATHLLLTATPKDRMSQRYGIEKNYHVLDDFGYGLAQKAGMVCPVVYKRHPYSFIDDPALVAQLTQSLVQAMEGKHSEQDIIQAVEQVFSGDVEDLDEENSQDVSKVRSVSRQIRIQIEREVIKERLDAMVNELIAYRDSLEHDSSGNAIFRPRLLAFTSNTESGMDIIRFIRQANGSDENTPPSQRNVYRGFRFGLDVSHFGKDPNDEARVFSSFNPGVNNSDELKTRFESMDPDTAVDAVIAVGKYTKGYNNDQLSVVALLRNVGEPSLINQIYTRPATSLVGKPKGVCLDLAFGLDNVKCWNESLELYDRKVDLENLYTQTKLDKLVAKVEESLKNTARTLDLDLEKLADFSHVVSAFENMTEQDRKSQGRRFILFARATADLMARMPDSSLYGHLRQPLVGLKISLSKLLVLYPELVQSSDVSDDGTLDAGARDKTLGEIIRDALNTLGQSSLKQLLDIKMGEAFEVIPSEREESVLLASQRSALTASRTAIESIFGRPPASTSDSGSTQQNPPTRQLRGMSALNDSLNRILDRLRDELPTQGASTSWQREILNQANLAIDDWLNSVNQDQGPLYYFLTQHLEGLLLRRAEILGLDVQALGLGDDLYVVVDQAAQDMSQDFNLWHRGLSSQWDEQSPKRLAQAWFGQYKSKNLADFLGQASLRQDLHSMSPADWIQSIATRSPPEKTRALFGNGADHELLSHLPPILVYSMELALNSLDTVNTAMSWRKSLEKKGAGV